MAVSHNYIFQNPVKFYVSSSCEKINKQKFISLSHGLHTPSCQSLAITPTNFKYLIKRALYKNYGFASHLSPCLTLNMQALWEIMPADSTKYSFLVKELILSFTS